MYLIEIFLPLVDNHGVRISADEHAAVEHALTERFGGVTMYSRAPAKGLWKDARAEKQEDDLVIYEVMTKSLDLPWWNSYRQALEKAFRQEKVLIRASEVQLL